MRPNPYRRSFLALALLAATVCTAGACGRPTPDAGLLAGASVVGQSPLPLPTLPSAIPAAGTRLTLPTVDLILEPPTGVDRARLAVPRAAKAFAIDRAYGDYYAPDFPTLADIALTLVVAPTLDLVRQWSTFSLRRSERTSAWSAAASTTCSRSR